MSQSLTNYLNKRIDELDPNRFNTCSLTANLMDYMEISQVLKACGHDTAELDMTITETSMAIEKLKKVQRKAIIKFKNEGVNFTAEKNKQFEDESESLT